MKRTYIQPVSEIHLGVLAANVLVKGSDDVNLFKHDSSDDIYIGDTDDANSFSKSLWDE